MSVIWGKSIGSKKVAVRKFLEKFWWLKSESYSVNQHQFYITYLPVFILNSESYCDFFLAKSISDILVIFQQREVERWRCCSWSEKTLFEPPQVSSRFNGSLNHLKDFFKWLRKEGWTKTISNSGKSDLMCIAWSRCTNISRAIWTGRSCSKIFCHTGRRLRGWGFFFWNKSVFLRRFQ